MEALEQFKNQPHDLEPGHVGWWRVYGAYVRHIRIGDIVILLTNNEEERVYIRDTFCAKADPVQKGFYDQDGKAFTIGALHPVIVYRAGTRNTLAE